MTKRYDAFIAVKYFYSSDGVLVESGSNDGTKKPDAKGERMVGELRDCAFVERRLRANTIFGV